MSSDLYDVVIVGGGPAGCAAAVYAARKQLRTLLITESFGGQSIVSNEIHNWIGDVVISGSDLAKRLEGHVRAFPEQVTVVVSDKVQMISEKSCTENEGKRICDFEVSTEMGKVFTGKTIILTSGARRRRLGVPGEDTYDGKGVAYCSTCDAPLFSGKDVIVVGGGNAGLEAAIDLLPYATSVKLLERSGSLRGDAVTQEELLRSEKIQVLYHTEVVEITGNQFVTGVTIQHVETGQEQRLDVGGVFVEIGSVPNTEMVKELVELDRFGQVVTDPQHAATSHKGIFAAGDVTDDPYKQNNISVGDGVRAALAAYAYLQDRPKVTPMDAE